MPVSCQPQLAATRQPVSPLLSELSGLCSIQIIEEPEEKFR